MRTVIPPAGPLAFVKADIPPVGVAPLLPEDTDPKGDVLPPGAVVDPSEEYVDAMRTIRIAADYMIREGVFPQPEDLNHVTEAQLNAGLATKAALEHAHAQSDIDGLLADLESIDTRLDLVESGGGVIGSGGLGVPLSHYGTVDTTGVTDMAPLINAAIADLSPSGVALVINQPGTYRLNSSVLLQDKTHIVCAPGTKFIAYFNSTTSGGVVMFNAALGFGLYTPLHNVTIIGGNWCRNGFVYGDNRELWNGNTGNMFSFYCLDMKLQGIQVSGYSGGRAFIVAGSGLIDDCHVRNYDAPETAATPVAGGTGAYRIYGGTGLKLTRLTGVSGDDCFQFVPGNSILDTVDCMYDVCWGVSLLGRVCIAYLGSRAIADPHNSILACSFSNIRGHGVYGINSSNGESDGNLDVLFQNVVVGMHVSPPHWPHQNRQIGFDIGSGQETHTGLATIRVRSCGLKNVIDGGMRVTGIRAALVDIDGWVQPMQSNPLSTRNPIHVQDAAHFRMNNFSVAVTPGSGKIPIYLGRSDEGTKVVLADLANGTIAGMDDGVYGVSASADGFIELNMDTVKFIPAAGTTTAGGIRFSDITERAMLRNVDFRTVGVPYANAPPTGVLFPNCRFATASPFVQIQPAAASISWNGNAKLMRVTTAAPITISNITMPAGFSFTELPIIYFTVNNNFAATLDGTGNLIVAGGSIVVTLRDVVGFIWDPTNTKWLQCTNVVVNP